MMASVYYRASCYRLKMMKDIMLLKDENQLSTYATVVIITKKMCFRWELGIG
jgi:hypothetical protein